VRYLLSVLLILAAIPAHAATLFPPTATPAIVSDQDTAAVVLGMRWQSSVAGTVTALRFYKGAANTGTHVGRLWTSTGTQLASATFTGETASGWQQRALPTAVTIQANTVYVVSYHAPVGRYSANNNYFTSVISAPPLSAPVSAGVYRYGTATGFPNQTWQASNYWVDVVFVSGTIPPPQLPAVPIMYPIRFTGNMQLSWDYTPGGGTPTEYVIESNIPPATVWTQAATTPYSGPTSTWDVSNMTPGAQYCFRVYARNNAGSSPASKPVCATIHPGTGLACVPSTCKGE